MSFNPFALAQGSQPTGMTYSVDMLIFLVVSLVAVVLGLGGVLFHMMRRVVTGPQMIAAAYDGYLDDEKSTKWFDANVGLTRPGARAATAFKEQFGEMKYNLANRAIAGDFIRRWLREEYPDMRLVDRIRHVDMAVELALTPTAHALAAASYASDHAIRMRRQLYQAPR